MLLSVNQNAAHAQIGAPKWPFRTRAQVERATKANLHNLRASYDIIMSARRVGMSQSVLKVYEQAAAGGPFQTPDKVAALYAFAFWVDSSAIRWNWKADRVAGICRTTGADAARITLYQQRAFAALPNSPEVLLFNALAQDRAGTDNLKNARRRLQLLDQAIKLAPRWGELHFWRSEALQSCVYELSVPKGRPLYPAYARKALIALDRAMQLDPTLRREGLVNKIGIYQMMGKPREALAALDAYGRVHPEWLSLKGVFERRQRLLGQIKSQGG